MAKLEPQRPLTPFQKIVAAIARVPKGDVDALASAEKAQSNGVKRGPKPKVRPA